MKIPRKLTFWKKTQFRRSHHSWYGFLFRAHLKKKFGQRVFETRGNYSFRLAHTMFSIIGKILWFVMMSELIPALLGCSTMVRGRLVASRDFKNVQHLLELLHELVEIIT